MLIATKITKKNKFYIYSFIILSMFSGGIFSIYQNYINNLELVAPSISTPAISQVRILDVDKLDEEKDESIDQATYKFNELLDLKILNDPKFRSLKKNSASTINVSPGKRNPFEP